MSTTARSGNPTHITAGLLERVWQRRRATFEVRFRPLSPLPQAASGSTPPRRFEYPSGVNLTTLSRGYEAIGFQQMRRLAGFAKNSSKSSQASGAWSSFIPECRRTRLSRLLS